jgi:antitoxin (DNA-binding transcriptional repressor) of toxin-antitoxin stability system
MTMKMAVSEFKSKCTMVLREIQAEYKTVEITNHGRVIAVISPPQCGADLDPKKFMGSLKGTASYVGDIVSPATDADEWEACR